MSMSTPTPAPNPDIRSNWTGQRAFLLAAWAGFVLALIVAGSLAAVRGNLPTDLWDYWAASRNSPATLDRSTAANLYGTLWIGLGIYAVGMIVCTPIWWRLRGQVRRASLPLGLAVASAIVGWLLVVQALGNIAPQLGGGILTRATAKADLGADAWIYGGGAVVVAILLILGAYQLLKRMPQGRVEQDDAGLVAGDF
jgi:hypothetical protein